MSFSFKFAVGSVGDARTKLHEAYAPLMVKALVEKALDAIEPPHPTIVNETASTVAWPTVPEPKKPKLVGVSVECFGHMAEAGSPGESYIERFKVAPFYS